MGLKILNVILGNSVIWQKILKILLDRKFKTAEKRA
jgi:hypothetical protein